MKKGFALCMALMLTLVSACSNNATSPADTFDTSADVVIIGAGGAGLAAAVQAADDGAESIIIVEKMGAIGGTSFISQGMIAGYDTQIQLKNDVHITYDEMIDNLMNNALYRLDPALTKITVEKSGETVDWLIDRLDVPFLPESIVGYGPYPMMHIIGNDEVMGGGAMREPFMNALTEAGVELMLETKATEILMNEDGSVKGIEVTTKDGEQTIGAKTVIIATGGYAYNPQLAELLTPEMAGTFGIGHPACTGDGIIMASNVGAALTHTDHLMAVLKDYEIMAEHNGNSNTANVSKFISRPSNILVDVNGVRFVDEKSGGYMTQELNSPIFDQMHKTNADYVWAIAPKAEIDEGEVVRGLDMEFISADSVEELATKMEVDVDTLTQTIAHYNEMAAAGVDTDFKRTTTLNALEGTLVAVKVVPCEIITYGGVARNEKAEVLRADGTSIAGLYVAGEAGANSAYMGFTLSNAITWGRIAGTQATAYTKK